MDNKKSNERKMKYWTKVKMWWLNSMVVLGLMMVVMMVSLVWLRHLYAKEDLNLRVLHSIRFWMVVTVVQLVAAVVRCAHRTVRGIPSLWVRQSSLNCWPAMVWSMDLLMFSVNPYCHRCTFVSHAIRSHSFWLHPVWIRWIYAISPTSSHSS